MTPPVNLTKNQIHILSHSLGLNYNNHPTRNSFCAGVDPGNADTADCRRLVDLGLMRAGKVINDGRDQYFHVTDFGASHVGAKLSDMQIGSMPGNSPR